MDETQRADVPGESNVPGSPEHTSSAASIEQGERIVAYWEVVRHKAGEGRFASVVGTGVSATVPPQAWSFGDDARIADELLALVLSGRKTATSSAVAEYGPEDPMPRTGELSILLDGAGEPRALIRTTRVDRVALEDVDAEFAAAEGEDDLSLVSWRREHEAYWRRVVGVDAVHPRMEVLCERFTLLDPR